MDISKCLSPNQKITELAQKFNISERTVMAVISTWRDLDLLRTDNDYPSDKLFERFNTDLSKTLEGYNLQSGGAEGSDISWDKIGKRFGITPIHYYLGERGESNAPYGNTEVSEEDYQEGRYESARAAAYNYGYQYKTMKDVRLIRNWSQIKHADAIFAIGHIVNPGERLFPNQQNDTRVALHPAVQGGTGYAVAMAILHGKPVYVFDQEDLQWYQYDSERQSFVKTDTPVLTPNFAGIGTRGINEAGRRAIEQVYQNTIAQNALRQERQELSRQQQSQPSQIQDINNISTNTANYGVIIDPLLKSNWQTWQLNNPDGIVAYRVNFSKYNTPEEANAGRIGNPFSEGIGQTNKGEDTVQKFYEWLVTGNNFGEAKATEEYRQAIISKILSTPETAQVLYYKELGRTSHATVIGYLIRHKYLLQTKQKGLESKIPIQKHNGNWTRNEALNNPNILYVFTDNTDRDSGHGVIPADSWYSKKYGEGHHFPTMTAAVVRGLENSRPISTQRWYHQGAKGVTGRWTDNDVEEFKKIILDELEEIVKEFNTGKYTTIMFPDGDGLFNTEISNITKERTPILYKTLAELLHKYGFDDIIPEDAKQEQQPQSNIQQSITDPTKITLTPEQSDVVDRSVEFISDIFRNPDNGRRKKYITISGMAGTGKTTIVRSIIENLRKQGFDPSIAVAAVARQAVNVLYEKTKDLKHIQPESVYSLSGVSEKNSEEEFVVDPNNNKFGKYNLIFVDEASMIDDKTFNQFDEYVDKNKGLVIVYLGDYGQIRPVKNRTLKSTIFSDSRCEVMTLTQRIRQGEGSPILQYADKFYGISIGQSAENVANIKDDKNVIQSNGALIFASTQLIEGDIIEAAKKAVEDENPNFIQITAYTNERVNYWNRLIHNAIFPESENKITNGDVIVFRSPYSTKRFSIANSTRGTVVEIIDTGEIIVSNTTIKTKKARIKVDKETYDVPIISQDDIDENGVSENKNKFEMVLEGLKMEALKYPKGSFSSKQAWRVYYGLKDQFADITFGYAVTVHKSQGSTYDIVVVDKDNITTNGNIDNQEKAELVYTGLTRSRNISVVIQGRSNMENLPASLLSLNEGIDEAKHTAADKYTEMVEELGNSVESVNEIQDAVKVAKKGLDYDLIQPFFTEEEQTQIREGLNGSTNLQVMSASRYTDPVFFEKEVIEMIRKNALKPLNDPTRANAIELWTKHDGLPLINILKACKEYRIAPMVSISITGLGNTAIEKGVMKYTDMLQKIKELIDKKYLDPTTTTIRVDPILVGMTNMDDVKKIIETCSSFGIKKFVTSMMQSYGYLVDTPRDRFVIKGINEALVKEGLSYDWEKYYGTIQIGNNAGKINFKPKVQYINEVGAFLNKIQEANPDISLQTCSFGIPGLDVSACLDPYIIQKLTGANLFGEGGKYNTDTSRPECRCYGCHGDVFRWNEKNCPSSCAYCYAAHSQDNPFNYYDENGNLIENEYTKTDFDLDSGEEIDSNIVPQNQSETRTIIRPLLPKDFAPRESDQSRVFSVFGNKLQVRINMFARDFVNTLNQLRVERIQELQQEKMNTSDLFDKMDKLATLKENRYEDRKKIIDIIGIDAIYDRMLQNYQKLATQGNEFAKRRGKTEEERQEYLQFFMQEYQKVVDNFDLLRKLASIEISKLNDLQIESQETDEVDEDGRNGASGNEGWGVKIHMINLHETTASVTRKILNNIPRLSSDGKTIERDDLGNIVYMDENEAHKMLVSICSDIEVAEDFDVYDKAQGKYIAFPILERANKKYKWITSVIKHLKQNPDDVDAFYADLRNDYFQYKTIKTVVDRLSGQNVTRMLNLNEKSFLESQFDQIQSYLSNGIILNKDLSIYDNAGKLTKQNIKKLNEFINSYKKEIQYVLSEKDITDSVVSNLRKILGAIGYPSSVEDIKSVLKNSDNPKSILDVVISNVSQLVRNVSNQTNEDYIIFNDNNGFYELIIKTIGIMDANFIAQTFRQNGNSYTSYTKPNFISMTRKLLKGSHYKERLDLYRKDKTFVDPSTGRFYFEWMNDFENDSEIRDKFDVFYVNSIDDIDYSEWTEKDVYRAFTEMYFLEQKKGFGAFNSPILADSPVAVFVEMKKYVDDLDSDFEDKLLPLFANIVKFEMARMARVEKQNQENKKHIANYNDKKSGLRFRFFPELNKMKVSDIYEESDDDTLFLDRYREILNSETNASKKADQFIMDAISKIMDKYYEGFTKELLKHGVIGDIRQALLDNNVISANSNQEEFDRKIKEFYWNNTFAEMNIVHLFGIDPAYTKSGTDFQKRWKQIYASGTKVNTAGKYGKKQQTVVYLKDVISRSRRYADIKFACDQMLLKGKITSFDRDNILSIFEGINHTDALAFRTLRSFEDIMHMLGKWDQVKDAVENLRKGEWDMEDFNKVLQTIKPFTYVFVEEDDGFGNTQLVPHHNKNSEFILLAFLDIINADLGRSEVLKGLSRFMEESGIDVAMYESAVKLGCSNPIDLTYSRSKVNAAIRDGFVLANKNKYSFDSKEYDTYDKIIGYFEKLTENGEISQDQMNDIYGAFEMTADETYRVLEEYTKRQKDDSDQYTFDESVVKRQDFDFWSVIQPTPEHYFDSLSVDGSLERNITIADLPDDIKINVRGKQMGKKEIIRDYTDLYIEDYLCSFFGEIDRKTGLRKGGFRDLILNQNGEFDSKKLVNKLQKLIEDNPKYSRQLKEAIQLINDGERIKTRLPFTAPQMFQLQQLVLSQARSKIINRKRPGGSAILVSAVGLTKQLNVLYEYTENGTSKQITLQEARKRGLNETLMRLVGVECYLPAYMKDMYSERYINKDKRKIKVLGQEKWKEYEVLDIEKLRKECPEALEAIGFRIPTENKYSITPLIIKGFLPRQNGSSIMVAADITALTGCDFDVDKMFLYFRQFHTDRKTGKISAIRYNPSKQSIPQMSKAQRINYMFDLKYNILTSPSTLPQFQNPGNFEQLKAYSRISYILQNKNVLDEFIRRYGKDKDAFDLLFGNITPKTTKFLDDFLEEFVDERNICTLDTFVYNHHQNQTGGNLIGVNAVGSSLHMKYQNADITLVHPININGKSLDRIDNLYTQDNWCISKLLAEFIAASVDNVKDPVLSNIRQNLSTANFALFLVRMGMNLQEVTLIFNNPILGELFEKNGSFDELTFKIMSMLRHIAPPIDGNWGPILNKLGIREMTSENLFNAIVNSSWYENDDKEKHSIEEVLSDKAKANTIGVLLWIDKLLLAQKPIGALTKISKFDSPKNAPSTLVEAMSQRRSVSQFAIDVEEKYSTLFNNLVGTKNKLNLSEDLSQLDIDDLRKFCQNGQVGITLAAYLFGYELPLQMISEYIFTLNNKNVQKMMLRLPVVYDNSLDDIFEKLLFYNLTNTTLFGDEETNSFAEKYKYYTQQFPQEFIQLKKTNETISSIPIIKMMDIDKKGRIMLKRSGRMDLQTKDVLTRNLDQLLFSGDPVQQKLAFDLFMYSFYVEKNKVDHSSFGQLFSTLFIEQFPEYIQCCELLKDKCESEGFLRQFEQMFYYNHINSIAETISSKDKFDVTNGVMTLLKARKAKFLKYSTNQNNNSEYDFGTPSESEEEEYRYYQADESSYDEKLGGYIRYDDVTDEIRLVKKNEIYYCGDMDVVEIGRILNSNAQYVNFGQEQSNDQENQDSEGPGLVEEQITYSQDRDLPQVEPQGQLEILFTYVLKYDVEKNEANDGYQIDYPDGTTDVLCIDLS